MKNQRERQGKKIAQRANVDSSLFLAEFCAHKTPQVWGCDGARTHTASSSRGSSSFIYARTHPFALMHANCDGNNPNSAHTYTEAGGTGNGKQRDNNVNITTSTDNKCTKMT